MAGIGTKPIDKYPSYRPPLSITINQAIKYMPTHHHQLTAWWKTNQITKSSLELNKLNPTLAQPRIHDTEQTSTHSHPKASPNGLHFPTWAQKGITHLRLLFENNNFM